LGFRTGVLHPAVDRGIHGRHVIESAVSRGFAFVVLGWIAEGEEEVGGGGEREEGREMSQGVGREGEDGEVASLFQGQFVRYDDGTNCKRGKRGKSGVWEVVLRGCEGGREGWKEWPRGDLPRTCSGLSRLSGPWSAMTQGGGLRVSRHD